MSKNKKFYVSFMFDSSQGIENVSPTPAFGYTIIQSKNKVNSLSSLKEMAKQIEKVSNFKNVAIVSVLEIKEDEFLKDEFKTQKKLYLEKLKTAFKEEKIKNELKDFLINFNRISGFYSTDSFFCESEPCKIFFKVQDLKALNDFCFNCLNGSKEWIVAYDVSNVSKIDHTSFCLYTKTKVKKQIIENINNLNKKIEDWLK